MVKYRIIIIFLLVNICFMTRLLAEDYGMVAEQLCCFGKAFLKEKRYTEAEHEFKKSLIVNPQNNEAKELLSLCEEKLRPAVPEEQQAALTSFSAERDKKMQFALEEAEKQAKQGPDKNKSAALKPSALNESFAPPIERGAWTVKKGHLYEELYTKYFWADSQFDDTSHKSKFGFDGRYSEFRVEPKFEYGLTDRFNLLLSFVVKQGNWKDMFSASTRKGFTEITPGIKYLLFEDPFIASLQVKTKFPLNFKEDAVPSLGQHQVDTEVRLLTAQPWPKLPGYTKLEFGFKGRRGDPSNELPYYFELGYNLTPSIILKTSLDGKEGLASSGHTDESLTKYTIGPIFKFKDLFNIELSFGQTFLGKNTSAGKEVIFTVSAEQ